MKPPDAYYVGACSPSPAWEPHARDHSDAQRQDGDQWTTLLRLDDVFDPDRPELRVAILNDHLGRPPEPDEVKALAAAPGLRWTPAELDRVLAPTRQLTLEVPA